MIATGLEPFDGDALERKPLAESLTKLVTTAKSVVISLEAPWGEGKTWFIDNWTKELQGNSHDVILIDAFSADHLDDPFVLLSGEIYSYIKSEGNSRTLAELKECLGKAWRSSAKTFLKVGVATAIKSAIGKNGFDEIATALSEALGDGASSFAECALEDYAEKKASIAQLRNTIQDIARKRKRLIIVIDELDRCKPTFAVELLECIKHLFLVENVVFVLAMNAEQMVHHIKHVYGAGTEADVYLQKFVNFRCSLPRQSSKNYESFSSHAVGQYMAFEWHGTAEEQKVEWRARAALSCCYMARSLALSLREIERVCAYVNLILKLHPGDSMESNSLMWCMFLAGLKVKNKEGLETLYRGSSIPEIENRLARADEKDVRIAERVKMHTRLSNHIGVQLANAGDKSFTDFAGSRSGYDWQKHREYLRLDIEAMINLAI